MKTLSKLFFGLLITATANMAFAEVQNRRVGSFTGISAQGSFDVFITQNGTEAVKVDAPGDIINKIKTEVVDGELRLYTKEQGWSWFGNGNKRVVIYISAKQLNKVSLSGSGEVSFKDGINTDNLKLRVSGSGTMAGRINAKSLESSVSGSGDMKIAGNVGDCSVSVSGSGDYSAKDVAARNIQIRVSGSGDATVNASERIDAHVSGSGDIRYTGAVKNVSSSKTGSGDVHRL